MEQSLTAATWGPRTTDREQLARTEALLPGEDEILEAPVEPRLVVGAVTPPEILTRASPTYPEKARQSRVQGRVILETIIDRKGNVTDMRVLRSIPSLDGAAKDAVCCWKYRPATEGGKPVSVFFTVLVEFTLK